MSIAPGAIWFLIIGSAFFVGPPVLIVGTSVWISTRRAKRGQGNQGRESSQDGDAAQAVRYARIGRFGGLLVGALAGAVVIVAGFRLLAPIIVAVGYLAGVLIAELRPTRPTGPVRAASLQARDAWQYLPRWLVPGIVAAAVLALVALVLFAVIPLTNGLPHGWMIVVSLPLAVIAVLAVTGLIPLMARVAALPQPASPDQYAVGRTRANAARAIGGAVLGIELLALGGLALVANSYFVGSPAHGGAPYLGSWILLWSGLGLALAGMVGWAILSRWRATSVAPPESAESGPATPRVA
jgi:hypothetical protein